MPRELVCTVVDINKWYPDWKCHSCGYTWDYDELSEFIDVFEPKLTIKGNISLRCPECFVRGKVRPIKRSASKKERGVSWDEEDISEGIRTNGYEEFF